VSEQGGGNLTSGVRLPAWAWALGAGIAMYAWTQNQFPTRPEEELKHQAVESRLVAIAQTQSREKDELEKKLDKLADIVEGHINSPAPHGEINQHTVRITNLEDGQRKIMERLETNEDLLRQIKASLDATHTSPVRR
jgi:uncharacterized protein HemX